MNYCRIGRWARPLLVAALAAAALLARTGAGGLAQSGNLSTYNVAHQLSFQYPSAWGVILDSTHITAVPAEAYGDGDAVGIRSPDGAAEIDLRVYGSATTTLEDLGTLTARDQADTTGHPNFQLLAAPSLGQVPGASNAASAEYTFTRSDGSTGHFLQLFAARGGVHYQLQTVADDALLAQYQDQLQKVAQSFQLLP